MKWVNKHNLSPRVVTDALEIDRLRWFQHRRYYEAGLLTDLATSLPEDAAVQRSTYFGAYSGHRIMATARIVGSGTMPMFDHHAISPAYHDRLVAEPGQVAEISRLAVDQTTPHHLALALLSREFLRFSMRTQQASLLIASVERPLVRILDKLLDIPVHVIGNEIAGYGHYRGACLPILIDTAECVRVFNAQASRYWEFFCEDLIIDLGASTRVRPTTSVTPEHEESGEKILAAGLIR